MPSKKSVAATRRPSDPELDLIRSLAAILDETGLSEIELDRKGTRVRVSRHVTAVATVSAPSLPIHHPSATMPSPKETATPEHPGAVKSPMVGTVDRSSAPGVAPFVEAGSEVREGQTLLIIEAMKTMNQIPAPRSGRVTHIFVESGQPVEFGEALAVIE